MPLPQYLKAQDFEDLSPLVLTSSFQHVCNHSRGWLPTSTTSMKVPKPKKEVVSKMSNYSKAD